MAGLCWGAGQPAEESTVGALACSIVLALAYLTEREVERLMKAAGNNRYGHGASFEATSVLLFMVSPGTTRQPNAAYPANNRFARLRNT
jgi:hypothetical protein